ncbi:arylsulfotransferase family protein [Geothrix sp. 21YS21S-2]|uniref:arylsulfotransferase family protein n=1 Tax=Geothrix sp. 21YS21S-2 TaxID=3068893 RepID=UPI0027BA935F|nr:arylsulfotransferase family protein [Geothrix sp. 21YS21S-2]
MGLTRKTFSSCTITFEVLLALAGLYSISCTHEGGSRPAMPIRLVPEISESVASYALVEASLGMPMAISLPDLHLPEGYTDAEILGHGSTIQLNDLAGQEAFTIRIWGESGAERLLSVSTHPPDFPGFTRSTSGPVAPGQIYTTTFDSSVRVNPPGYNLILSETGDPVYFHRLIGYPFNFQKFSYANGVQRYAFAQTITDDLVLLDANFRELRRHKGLQNTWHGTVPADVHDFIFYADDHYVLASTSERIMDLTAFGGKSDSHVKGTIIQEIQDGQVLWEWDSTDYPQFFSTSTDSNDYTNTNPASKPAADYMHFNSMALDPKDNGYILSFRHQDAIIKILPFAPRDSHSLIQIKWVLGGGGNMFTKSSPWNFFHQHMARIVSRSGQSLALSLFDNNNGHYDLSHSSGKVLSLDEDRMTADLIDQYPGSANTVAMGSFQYFGPGECFFGWGTTPRITEISGGQTTFSLEFAKGIACYRAFKIR